MSNRAFDVEASGHGPFTGRCILETNTCEVFAWCPMIENNVFRDFSPESTASAPCSSTISFTEKTRYFQIFSDLNVLEERRALTEHSFFQDG